MSAGVASDFKVRDEYFDGRSASLIAKRPPADTGGGGGTPVWVPANAKIYIDLIAPGRAWTEADGEVAINTLLGTDANTVNGWGATSYDAGNLTADGYGNNSSEVDIGLLSVALTSILATATIVIRAKDNADAVGGGSGLVLLAADGNDALEIDIVGSTTPRLQGTSWGGSIDVEMNNIINTLNGAINCAAITIDGTRFELAANGSDPATGVIASDDRPTGNPLVAALIYSNAKKFIQSITIYDALPSTTGLSALSETGVTNTAPTFSAPSYSGEITDGSVATHELGSGGVFGTMSVVASDPQGSPVTFSISGAESIIFTELNVDGYNCSVAVGNPSGDTVTPIAGDYSFTLRATDPGGLYVEQQFTITVTA